MNFEDMSVKAAECADKYMAQLDQKTIRAIIISAYCAGVVDGTASATAEIGKAMAIGHAKAN